MPSIIYHFAGGDAQRRHSIRQIVSILSKSSCQNL